jgi:hypothetical protein
MNRIFTVHQRVRKPVIELGEIRQARYLPIRFLDFYWFTDCLRVVRILTIRNCSEIRTRNLRVETRVRPIKFLSFTLEKIRSLVKVTFFFLGRLSTGLKKLRIETR